MTIQPRYLRLRDAPGYCGMAPALFNKEIRPYLAEISIGVQGKAFDRLDLDKILEKYKRRYGRPARKQWRDDKWEEKQHQDSISPENSGTSTRSSKASVLESLLAQAASKKQKSTSQSASRK